MVFSPMFSSCILLPVVTGLTPTTSCSQHCRGTNTPAGILMHYGRLGSFHGKSVVNRLSAQTLTLALSVGLIHQAHATEHKDLYTLSLDELVNVRVDSASLLPTKRMEAAATVDVVSRAQWQRFGARRTLDAVSHLPATVVLPMHLGADALAIRGYGSVNAYSGTAVHWDGVPLNDLFIGSAFVNLPNINLDTLDTIELIRGPGSALYGSDAFHGVLALTAFDAEYDVEQISADVGSNDFYSAGGRWSTQAYPGARIHMAAASSEQGDQARRFSYDDPLAQEKISNERGHEYSADTFTLKLNSDDKQAWSYGGGLYVHQYDANDFSGLGTVIGAANDRSAADTRFQMAQFHVTRKLDAASSVELQSYLWQMDMDAITFLQPSVNETLERHQPREQQRQGGKITYRHNDDAAPTRWALVSGADKIEMNSAEMLTYAQEGTLLSAVDHPASEAERTITYVTFEADTRWNDDTWRVVYGGRYDDYSDVGQHLSPRVGLIYIPQPGTSIKLLYGNAFRAPSAFELNSTSVVLGNPNLEPEILDNYELVVMWHADQWRWQGELFHSLWRETIVAAVDPDNNSVFRYANIDRSTSNGIALGVERRFAPWLLGCNLSYVESENQTADTQFGMFPTYIVDWHVGYDFYHYDTVLYLNQRFYSHTDDVLEAEAGFEAHSLPTYWRTDLSLTHHVNLSFDMIATVHNLFNRDNVLPSPLGSKGGIPDEPFNMSVGFRYAF